MVLRGMVQKPVRIIYVHYRIKIWIWPIPKMKPKLKQKQNPKPKCTNAIPEDEEKEETTIQTDEIFADDESSPERVTAVEATKADVSQDSKVTATTRNALFCPFQRLPSKKKVEAFERVAQKENV
ncbi:hypothetical protein KQX54_010312 [Cotesia glomerata]|uniref:Uncharacterized protein n=1 Tax=Cotesia glomerata TaxID=32391 RepID=A0AAV7IB39_COTGL|nr:hypothetical protein KQX54_010312 [Cotesia glomerata]